MGESGVKITGFRPLSAQFIAHECDGGASGQLRVLIELADAVEDGGPLFSVGAVNQMAHNAMLVHHDSQRETLTMYPRHHVTGFDEMGPGEVVLLGNLAG